MPGTRTSARAPPLCVAGPGLSLVRRSPVGGGPEALVAIGDRTGGRFVVDVGPPDFSSRDCRVVTLWGSRVRAWILHTERRYEGGGQRVETLERGPHHFGLGLGRKPKTPTRALSLPCPMKAHASCERAPCMLHDIL